MDITTIGTAICSSTGSGNINNIFNKDTNDTWSSGESATAIVGNSYVGRDFSSSHIVTSITFRQWTSNNQSSCSTVKIQYWNGSAWVDIQTQSVDYTVTSDIPINPYAGGSKFRVLANANANTGGNFGSGTNWWVTELLINGDLVKVNKNKNQASSGGV